MIYRDCFLFTICKTWIEFTILCETWFSFCNFYVKHDCLLFLWTWSCFSNFSWCLTERPITYSWNCFRKRYRVSSFYSPVRVFKFLAAFTVFHLTPSTPEKISGMFTKCIFSPPISCKMKPQKITDKRTAAGISHDLIWNELALLWEIINFSLVSLWKSYFLTTNQH